MRRAEKTRMYRRETASVLFILATICLIQAAQTSEGTTKADTNLGGRCNRTSGSPKVSFELYVMSKCPYGTQMVSKMPKVVEAVGDSIDLSIDYIADYNKKNLFQSLHGQTEVEGDIWQLCAMKHYPDVIDYLPFLDCMGQNVKSIPRNVETCSQETNLNYGTLQTCFSKEGPLLLKDSIERSKSKHARISPTIIIGGRHYVGDRAPENLIKAICYNEGEFNDDTSAGTPPQWKVVLWYIGMAALVVGTVLPLVIGCVAMTMYLWRRGRQQPQSRGQQEQQQHEYQLVPVISSAEDDAI